MSHPSRTPRRYRGYFIEYKPLPLPVRRHDWEFVHEDYDGESDGRCGTGADIEDCMNQINEIEEYGA